MAGRFDGKVAFITGVARGQGRAHALRLAKEGAHIVGIDICRQIASVDYPMSTTDDLAETTKLVQEFGGEIISLEADVRSRDAIDEALQEGIRAFGRINFVVANAGIMPIWGPASNTMEAWQDCQDVLLTGVLNTVEATYPAMIKKGDGGSIVITSSMAGVKPMMRTLDGCTLGLLGYCAAKAALVSLAQNYASILAYHRIRVNTVHPTGVTTPMIENETSRHRFDVANPEDLKALVNAIPVDAVSPEDIANAVAWLCSDDSAYFTGSAMHIDAGAGLR